MKCRLIPEECITCGRCLQYAPEVFDYYDNGVVRFKQTENDEMYVLSDAKNDVRRAAQACPTHAIHLTQRK